jgi:hypothetical protein
MHLTGFYSGDIILKMVSFKYIIGFFTIYLIDCLCGLVVRVPGYRSSDPGFHSRRYQIFWEVVSLERDPLSLVRITEEVLEKKVAAPA